MDNDAGRWGGGYWEALDGQIAVWMSGSRQQNLQPVNWALIGLQGTTRWKHPHIDSRASRWWRRWHFKVLMFQRPKFHLQQMSLHNAKYFGLKNKAVTFYFMGGRLHHLEMKTGCLWQGREVNILRLVIHFYLVEEADVVIVFIDRDLEQSLPLRKRHFRKPIKIRGRRKA